MFFKIIGEIGGVAPVGFGKGHGCLVDGGDVGGADVSHIADFPPFGGVHGNAESIALAEHLHTVGNFRIFTAGSEKQAKNRKNAKKCRDFVFHRRLPFLRTVLPPVYVSSFFTARQKACPRSSKFL